MKRFSEISALILCFLLAAGVLAEGKGKNKNQYAQTNEVRLGIGDPMFETLVWYDQVHKDYSGCADPKVTGFDEKRNYRYSPHISLQYSRRLLPWLLVGADMDFQNTSWTKETYSNTNSLIATSKENFFNLCFMPYVRFNYFRREHVELYSGLGLGMDINGGSETDAFGNHTLTGIAAQFCAIGVAAGKDHWWGFFDLGGTYALKNGSNMFMLSSQIMKIGVAYRF